MFIIPDVGDDIAIQSETKFSISQVDKLRTEEDLEVEFASTTDKIK